MRRDTLAILASTFGSACSAQILSATFDILDGSDPGAPSPPGVIVIDGFVDVASTDVWTAAGIRCVTANGATLRYADGDFNTPGIQPIVINTGSTNDRFVTVLSRPRGRNALIRFDNGGAGTAGGYTGGPNPPETDPTNLDAAWVRSPPAGPGEPSVDGYVIRVAFDASGFAAETAALTTSPAPPNEAAVLLAAIEAPTPGRYPGWVNASFAAPSPVGGDWYLWGIVPEPASAALLLVGALASRGRLNRAE